jgi:hypothetical protein
MDRNLHPRHAFCGAETAPGFRFGHGGRSGESQMMTTTITKDACLYSWIAGGTAMLLIAWRVFWMNKHGIGAHSNSSFALPMAVMTMLMGLVVLMMINEYGSLRTRRITTTLVLLLTLITTEPWEMIASP